MKGFGKATGMLALLAMLPAGAQLALAGDDAEAGKKLFKKKCAMCHKVDRKKVGPALKAMNTDPEALKATIANGRKMMPAFGKKLDAEQIDALVAYIRATQGEAAKDD